MSFRSRGVREHTAAVDEWVFVYEWFAGWRWEHHRDGTLHDETLVSYQTFEECVTHAGARGYRPAHARRPRPRLNRAPRAAAQTINDAAADRSRAIATA